MTEERQRIAIAVFCRWSVKKWPESPWLSLFDPSGRQRGGKWKLPEQAWNQKFHGNPKIPDYLRDLNAMRDAVAKLPEDLYDQFEIGLSNLILGIPFDTYAHWSEVGGKGILKATAAQWAEAFLRTIGKWEEVAS